MIYLKSFDFPSVQQEINYTWRGKKTNLTCYSTDAYPFKILSGRGLFRLDFDDITILYGGNGSGKSTALNIIAEKLGLSMQNIWKSSGKCRRCSKRSATGK